MIDYNNKIFDIVDKVNDIVSQEMAIPLLPEHSGNHSIVVEPISDNLIELISKGQSRQYSVLISYELNTGGNYTQNNFKQVANVAEHIKRLFAPDNNADVSNYWHGGEIESVEYERDDEDESKIKALITFNCINMEVS